MNSKPSVASWFITNTIFTLGLVALHFLAVPAWVKTLGVGFYAIFILLHWILVTIMFNSLLLMNKERKQVENHTTVSLYGREIASRALNVPIPPLADAIFDVVFVALIGALGMPFLAGFYFGSVIVLQYTWRQLKKHKRTYAIWGKKKNDGGFLDIIYAVDQESAVALAKKWWPAYTNFTVDHLHPDSIDE